MSINKFKLIILINTISILLSLYVSAIYALDFSIKGWVRNFLLMGFSVFIIMKPGVIKFFPEDSLYEANVRVGTFLAFLISFMNLFLNIMFIVESLQR